MRNAALIALAIAAVSATLAGQKKDTGRRRRTCWSDSAAGRLADVQPDVRRAAVQPARVHQPAQRPAVEDGVDEGDCRTATTRAFRSCHQGVMYLVQPGASVIALNATNGDGDLGIQTRHAAGVAHQDARHLSRSRLLRRSRRLHRRARRGDRQSALGNQNRRRHDVGSGRHRRQGADGPHVRDDDGRTATSPRTTR